MKYGQEMENTMKRVLCFFLAGMLLFSAAAGCAVVEEENSVYHCVNEKRQIYRLADSDYLIEDYRTYFVPEAAITQAESFNRVLSAFPEVQTYVYLASSSRSLDFDHLDREQPLYARIKEQYPDSTTACLPIYYVEDYYRYFFKTDHHWNYQGSYLAYRQIIRMLLGRDEPLLDPVETVEFPVFYNGSLNKDLGRDSSDEPFTVYRFDFPKMTVRVNGNRKNAYGRQDAYFAGKYKKKDKLTNHYSEFYGGDVGLVSFSTGDESKENILIFSNSFSNALDMLVASHFNNTYFVDMRHYKEDMNEKFNLTESIKKWNISKVMLLGDAYFFKWGTTYR